MQKTALITGCSKGGIGDALALEFHERGVRVFSTARNLLRVEHHKALGIETIQLDVTDEGSIGRVVKEVERLTGGRLDFLVNNAGMGYTKPLLDADLKVAKDVFDLNFFSVLAVTQALAPQVIAAKGKVINIGSLVGKMAQPYYGVYNASKAAANLLSETLRLELAPFGVQVITVVTGVINTQFFGKQGAVHLPDNSLYTPIQSSINRAAAGEEFAQGAMDPAVYARGVVDNALKETSELWYWRGAKIWVVWAMTTLLWHRFPDSTFSQSSGLIDLKKAWGARG